MLYTTSSSSFRELSREISMLSKDPENVAKKKSILVIRGKEPFVGNLQKRGSSKATIQWKEGIKEKSTEDEKHLRRSSLPPALGLLVTRGSKWKYIQDFMIKLKSEEARMKGSDEDFQGQKIVDRIMTSFGSAFLHKRHMKSVELTMEQEDKLEVLKQQLKAENDNYLKRHPELDLLLMLVYRRLLKCQPDDPELFVSNYVHYLNTHREELVLEEVDVPFDKVDPQARASEKMLLMDEEKEKITLFARALVERCAKIASHGVAYVNITSILDSMLLTPTPSVEIPIDTSLRSAEIAVSSILASLLRSVSASETKSSEYIVEEILESVLEHVQPPIEKDSQSYIEVRESVEQFVKTLLKTVMDKAGKQVKLKEAMRRQDSGNSDESYGETNFDYEQVRDSLLSMQQTSKPILKKLNSDLDEEEFERNLPKPETRVKFQSFLEEP